MSKTIYLDGTETLIYTQQLIDPSYRAQSPLEDFETALLVLLGEAAKRPGQRIVVELPAMPYHEIYRVERKFNEMMKVFGFYRRDYCDFHITQRTLEFQFKPPNRDGLDYNDLQYLRTHDQWKSTL